MLGTDVILTSSIRDTHAFNVGEVSVIPIH